MDYEVYFCTKGIQPYAHQVIQLLDAEGSLFEAEHLPRRLCCETRELKALRRALHLSEGTGSQSCDPFAVIVDDRLDVGSDLPLSQHLHPCLTTSLCSSVSPL